MQAKKDAADHKAAIIALNAQKARISALLKAKKIEETNNKKMLTAEKLK